MEYMVMKYYGNSRKKTGLRITEKRGNYALCGAVRTVAKWIVLKECNSLTKRKKDVQPKLPYKQFDGLHISPKHGDDCS